MKDDDKIGCVLLILMALAMPFCMAGCYGCSKVQVSDGYRDSTVRKVSETGVIWKTWEVETLGDGMRAKGSGDTVTMGPETFRYTVSDPAVLKQIQDLPPGVRVRVHYRKQLASWAPSGETQYFITRIENIP